MHRARRLVENRYAMTERQQACGQVRADEAAAADDQYAFHRSA
jgi:hypothetical protein